MNVKDTIAKLVASDAVRFKPELIKHDFQIGTIDYKLFPYSRALEITGTRVIVGTVRPNDTGGVYTRMNAPIDANTIHLESYDHFVFVHEVCHAVQDHLGFMKELLDTDWIFALTHIEIQACVATCMLIPESNGVFQHTRYIVKDVLDTLINIKPRDVYMIEQVVKFMKGGEKREEL